MDIIDILVCCPTLFHQEYSAAAEVDEIYHHSCTITVKMMELPP